MTRFLFILLLSLICLSSRQDKYPYPYHNNKPSTKGIIKYVEDNQEQIVMEYQQFVHDTIYDIYFETDNINEYYGSDSSELGYFYIPNSVVITNQEMFKDYELNNLSRYEKKSCDESNNFVKGVMIHEITHDYFYQILREMKSKKMRIALEYRGGINMYPNNNYSAEFIEEGICEYVACQMGETIPYNERYKPKDMREILDNKYKYIIKYRYSRIFVTDFLNKYYESGNLKLGIEILLSNTPPTLNQLLTPDIYFNTIRTDIFR
jgi:hypothetical protein